MPKIGALDIKKILLPVDFDGSNRSAAYEARVLARHFGAAVTLLHVNGAVDYLVSLPLEAEEVTENRLQAFAAAELRGITVNPLVSSGDPAAKIVEFANHEGCDLVLMPARRHGPVRRFMLGSVTRKVLDCAQCPVWTVANSQWDSRASAPKRILCGVNFSPPTRKTIRWAASFADASDASLMVMCVLPVEPPGNVPDWYVPQWNEGVLPGLESRLRELLKDLRVKAEILIDEGDAAPILTNTARSTKSDLIVIGRRCGQGSFGRLGPNTDAIVRHAPCPVVSV